ncbi:hypothetical protein VZT92_016500 [Zoarces viviparus]|uniref:Uncharacterized protein n=1 Tax=Zoarces viviparus TaxID=48416 RepID=A0AAW1EU28_ZOAVI
MHHPSTRGASCSSSITHHRTRAEDEDEGTAEKSPWKRAMSVTATPAATVCKLTMYSFTASGGSAGGGSVTTAVSAGCAASTIKRTILGGFFSASARRRRGSDRQGAAGPRRWHCPNAKRTGMRDDRQISRVG